MTRTAKDYMWLLIELLPSIDEMYRADIEKSYFSSYKKQNTSEYLSDAGGLTSYSDLDQLLPRLAVVYGIPPNYYLPHRCRKESKKILEAYHKTAPEATLIRRYQAYLDACVAALQKRHYKTSIFHENAQKKKHTIKERFWEGVRHDYAGILARFYNEALSFEIPIKNLLTQQQIDSEDPPFYYLY